MPDVAEGLIPPPAADQTGMLTVWWVKKISDTTKPKVSEIGAGVRITYSLTSDGYSLDGSQKKEKDDRLTKKQALESLGATDVSLKTLKYVESDDPKSANQALLEGEEGFLVDRRGVDNNDLIAVGHKVRVIPVVLGAQLAGPIDGNGKFTILQETALTGEVGLPVAVVAGA